MKLPLFKNKARMLKYVATTRWKYQKNSNSFIVKSAPSQAFHVWNSWPGYGRVQTLRPTVPVGKWPSRSLKWSHTARPVSTDSAHLKKEVLLLGCLGPVCSKAASSLCSLPLGPIYLLAAHFISIQEDTSDKREKKKKKKKKRKKKGSLVNQRWWEKHYRRAVFCLCYWAKEMLSRAASSKLWTLPGL